MASIGATLSIPADAIDHELARGLRRRRQDGARSSRPASRCCWLPAAAHLRRLRRAFHFANAAMLPLVGQKLALADEKIGTR